MTEPALTAAELRKALEGVSDDMPVQLVTKSGAVKNVEAARFNVITQSFTLIEAKR